MWDVVDILWTTHIERHGLWDKTSQLKSATTKSKIQALKKHHPALATDLDQFDQSSERARFGLLKSSDTRDYLALSGRLVEAFDAAASQVCTRTPISGAKGYREDWNSASVETKKGFKSIFLRHAMVTQQDVDLIILTTLAGTRPGGFIVNQMRSCFEYESDPSRRFLQIDEGRWTTLQMGNYPQTPFKNLLTVSLPNITEDSNRSLRIETMCKAILASLAAMEAMGHQMQKMALPVLQAHLLKPGSEYEMLIGHLLRMGVQWLDQSRFTTEISFCVYYGDEISTWSREFDKALGRTRIENGDDQVTQLLREEMISLSVRLRDSKLAAEAEGIRQILTNTPIQTPILVTGARKLVERLCTCLYSTNNKKRPYELWKQIEGLSEFKVAPWIRSYLHTLRILGNEGVHVRDDAKAWAPNSLNSDDLRTALIALRSVYGFCLSINWEQDDEA